MLNRTQRNDSQCYYIQQLKNNNWITLCDVKEERQAKHALWKWVKNNDWTFDKFRIFTEDGKTIQLTQNEVLESMGFEYSQ